MGRVRDHMRPASFHVHGSARLCLRWRQQTPMREYSAVVVLQGHWLQCVRSWAAPSSMDRHCLEHFEMDRPPRSPRSSVEGDVVARVADHALLAMPDAADVGGTETAVGALSATQGYVRGLLYIFLLQPQHPVLLPTATSMVLPVQLMQP